MSRIDRTVGRLAERAQAESTNRQADLVSAGEILSLEEAFPDARPDGSGCLILEDRSPTPLLEVTSESTMQALLGELRLVYGIGERYTARLRDDGYRSIVDLHRHPRWGDASKSLLEQWGAPPRADAVYRSLERWLPSADPLQLRSLGLFPIDRLLFFDLETLGLGSAPVFLAAVGRFVAERGFVIRQVLAPSPSEEIALLERMESEILDASALLSYNGKSFDWTVLGERFAYYGLRLPAAPVHIDLLHHARRAFRCAVPDCHLGTIERRVLGIERTDDLPSAEVPTYYAAYLETGNAAYLVPIVRHSRQDLASLVALLDRLLRMADDA